MLLILRHRGLLHYSLKHRIVQTSKVLRRRLEILTKRYPTLVGWSRRLTTTQKNAEIENKTPSVTWLVTTAILNTKGHRDCKKIHDITNQATKAAMNTKVAEVESKIPHITNLARKATLDAKPSCLIPQFLLILLNLID